MVKGKRQERIFVLKEQALTAEIEQIKLGNAVDRNMDASAEDRIWWGNDLSFILALIPAILAFYPPAVPAVLAGFNVLGSMPVWYQYMLGMMLVSVWGYRSLVVPIIKARLGIKTVMEKKDADTADPKL